MIKYYCRHFIHLSSDCCLILSLRKLAHAIYRDFFSEEKKKIISLEMFDFLKIFSLKRYIVIIHNACFGSKLRKLGIPLQTPVFFFSIKVGFKGYK